MIEERDKLKEEAKGMALLEGETTSNQQVESWCKYRELRININNRVK